MRIRAGRAALLVLASIALGACSSGRLYVSQTSHDAAKSAVEGAAEGVGSVPGPLRRALRDTLLGDDTLPLVSQRIAEAMVDGMRRGLSEAETQQLIDDVVERTIAGLGRESGEATRQLIQTIEPELSQALRRSIGSIGVAVGEDIERDLTPRTREMAQALADVLVKALAGGLDVQLEHIRQTARDIGREMITEAALSIRDQKEFVGEITHVAMRQGMLGAIEGAREIFPDHVPRSLVLAMIVLAGLVILSGGGFGMYWWRYRQSTKSLTIIAKQLNDFEAGDLKDAIHKSADEHYVGRWLSNFLTRRGL